MAIALKKRYLRRAIWLLLLVAATVVLIHEYTEWAYRLSVPPAEFTGWLVASCTLFLTLLNVRKKLTRIPLFRVTNWLHAHIYVGLFSGVLFLIHIDFSWPSAMVNVIIFILFILVFFSGLVGLWLSRFIPHRLKERGEEVIFERIPAYRHTLHQELLEIIDRDLESEDDLTLSDYAINVLLPFFNQPRNRLRHLLHSNTHRYQMLNHLDSIGRFLNPKARQVKERIESMVRTKDDLDYSEAHQMLLKYWLFIHIPVTYGLLIILPVHIAWALILQHV